MSTTEHRQRLEQTTESEVPVTLKHAGVAGAGGAGFPTHAKWERLEEVDHLLVNHQESEPNYFMDKWLGQEHADELATLFDFLLDDLLETVVIGAKAKDRDTWMGELESVTEGTVYMPEDLPIDPSTESGVVFAYTEDEYEYGMEQVLLRFVADVIIGKDLPMDHGWLVQNTETLYNMYRALLDGSPVTRKYIHIAGDDVEHRFLEVPVGTPASALIRKAGLKPSQFGENQVLLDGGPGWCFEIERDPEEFGVRKRSNAILVLDRETVDQNTLGSDRVSVINQRYWAENAQETEPSGTIVPDYVRVPLISNPAFEGVVAPSKPIVEPGDSVSEGEMIATPATDGISNTQHASVSGTVRAVSDTHIEIKREDKPSATMDEAEETEDPSIYWTWCLECGTYVIPPRTVGRDDPTRFVCEDCRKP